ncbi:MAG: hypothetical protein NT157_02550 [Candidatus Micrarchaeota archaeon]|nr:hypothetical protein [Candidatus Micrarchaeota archaeon]
MSVMDANLNKAWKSTFKIIFGRELGGIDGYQEWLGAYLPKKAKRKSYVSDKEVAVAMDSFSENARFVSADEVAQNKEYGLEINQIKDIDSIILALKEKCEYAGNRHLGKSAFVESSDIVIDSQYVRNSSNVEESRYVESSFMIRKGSKYIFGCGALGDGEFLVRVVDSYGQKRTFESSIIGESSDCYFCHNVLGCHDMIFCFGQRNRSHCIGNTQLPKERYQALKAKILGEVADILEREKRFPSLSELVPTTGPSANLGLALPTEKETQDMAVIEKGFSSTYNLLLRKVPTGINDYAEWLSRRTVYVQRVKTPFGTETYIPENMPVLKDFPRSRVVTGREAIELGKRGIKGELVGLESIAMALGDIAFFTPELREGDNSNLIGFPHAYYIVNGYRGYDSVHAKDIAISSFALNSKYAYGCHRVLESEFSIKCYNSQYLNRCFELDSCNKCADSYFCHNSEALSECMFCFNLKGRRHCIGNTQLDKNKYASIKNAILGQIAEELDRKKSLGLSIFNIG